MPRIAHQQDVDVATDARSVRQVLFEARDQLQRQRLFHVVVAVDGGSDGSPDLFVDLRITGHLHDQLLLLGIDLNLLELLLRHLHTDAFVDEVEVGALALLGRRALVGLEYAVDDNAVTGKDPAGQVVLQLDVERLRLRSAPQVLGGLLHPDLLGIHELGLGQQELEGPAPVAGLVHALEVLVLEFVAGLLLEEGEAAPLALEGGRDDLGPDLGGGAHQPVDGQQFADVVASKLPGLEMTGQLDDAHMGPVHVNIHGQVQLQEGSVGRLQDLLRIFQQLLGEFGIEPVNV